MNINKEFHLGDLQSIVTGDGETYIFDDRLRIIAYGGYGMPPITWQTNRAYRQHGETVLDYRLGVRSMEMTLVIDSNQSRDAYWAARAKLVDISRPNRQGPLTLTIKRSDGTLRSITCRPNPGAIFPPASDNSWILQEPFTFIAHDPTWFDPAIVELSASDDTDDQLVFPITFAANETIWFGTSGVFVSTGTISYPGTWRSYPIITVYGPYNTCLLTNQGNGAVIILGTPVITGDVRIINLDPSERTIVDGDGISKINELATLSNLVDFAIYPQSELSATQEVVANFVSGSAGVSTFGLTYYPRYIGI